MTDYEYKLKWAQDRKEALAQENLKKKVFLVHKQEYLRAFIQSKRSENRVFLKKSRLAQRWIIRYYQFLSVKVIKQTIKKRIEAKRIAYARVGSIFVIERVMSQFLKKFRRQRERRTLNKIKFSFTAWSHIVIDLTEDKCKQIICMFL